MTYLVVVPCIILSTLRPLISSFFFFNDTATTEIYTLSLHDALPISAEGSLNEHRAHRRRRMARSPHRMNGIQSQLVKDRKSTRLNSSHLVISYAVFCLKKKTKLRLQHCTRLRDCVPKPSASDDRRHS